MFGGRECVVDIPHLQAPPLRAEVLIPALFITLGRRAIIVAEAGRNHLCRASSPRHKAGTVQAVHCYVTAKARGLILPELVLVDDRDSPLVWVLVAIAVCQPVLGRLAKSLIRIRQRPQSETDCCGDHCPQNGVPVIPRLGKTIVALADWLLSEFCPPDGCIPDNVGLDSIRLDYVLQLLVCQPFRYVSALTSVTRRSLS